MLSVDCAFFRHLDSIWQHWVWLGATIRDEDRKRSLFLALGLYQEQYSGTKTVSARHFSYWGFPYDMGIFGKMKSTPIDQFWSSPERGVRARLRNPAKTIHYKGLRIYQSREETRRRLSTEGSKIYQRRTPKFKSIVNQKCILCLLLGMVGRESWWRRKLITFNNLFFSPCCEDHPFFV